MFVPRKDVIWVFENAQARYAPKKINRHKPPSGDDDEPDHSADLRLFFEDCRREGMTKRQAVRAVKADKGYGGDAYREHALTQHDPERAVDRAWHMSNPKAIREKYKKPPIRELEPISILEEKSVAWHWWPYLPGSRITILAGPEGAGKGLVCVDLATRFTLGKHFPFTSERPPKGGVLLMEAEDNFQDTIKPRLMAAGADMERVFPAKLVDQFYDIPALIKRHDLKLIVVSPLNLFLQASNQNAYKDVGTALAKLQEAVEDTDCAIIAITHLNKNPDLTSLERIIGSRAFTAFVRNVLIMRKDDDGVVRLMHAKPSLSEKGDDLMFEIRHTNPNRPRDQYVAIKWSQADENVEIHTALSHKSVDERPTAAEWLFNYLKEHGETERKVIKQRSEAESRKWVTILKVKQTDPRFEGRSEGFGPNKKAWWRIRE
jgi:hypothetical protein